jgi:hypothetical protein
MNKNAVALAVVSILVSGQAALAQEKGQSAANAEASPLTAPKELNLQEYVKLLREDVRSQKSAVMRAVMQLDSDDAAKFWPIYREYDVELTKVNDLRAANIEEYARTYNQLTDGKADELIRRAIEFQKQRADLLAKCYERMKGQLGGVTAARFVQIEHQLLLIIDLQIASSLPVAGS